MSLTRKYVQVEKKGMGRLAVSARRYPFRLFGGEAMRVFYQPDLQGAAWHEVDYRRVDVQVLLGSTSPFTAMAYLRSLEKN